MTGENSLPTSENKLPPCELFSVLDWRKSQTRLQCDVCDRPEAEHQTPGRRTLSGAEIEDRRRRMLVAMYEKLEEERRSVPSNGKATDAGGSEPS